MHQCDDRDLIRNLMRRWNYRNLNKNRKRWLYEEKERDTVATFDKFLTDVMKFKKKPNGRTELHHAVEWGKVESTAEQLRNGANVNVKDKIGKTPLHLIVGRRINIFGNEVEERLEKITQLLISNGAEIEERDRKQRTPLFIAVLHRKARAVNILLDNGAQINARDKHGMSPLHFAVKTNNLDMTKLLLDRGANVLTKSRNGSTPLHLAAQTHNLDMTKLLLERGASVLTKNRIGSSSLHLAVQTNNLDMTKLLLDRGASVLAKNRVGSSPLHLAVERNNLDIAKLLLNRGAMIEDARNNLCTALHVAAVFLRRESINLLISHKANVNAKDENGKTALHLFLQNYVFGSPLGEAEQYKRIVESLLSAGVCVNSVTNEGNSLLHTAATAKNKDMVELLLERGADVNLTNNIGETPLHQAVKSNNESVVKILLKKGANVNVQRQDGKSALHVAAELNNEYAVEQLLKHKADFNAMDQRGRTPLSMCNAMNSYSRILRLFAMYFAKSKTPNICAENLRQIEGNTELREFYKQCVIEIDLMKINNLCPGITFYQMLTGSETDLAIYTRNKNVRNIFNDLPCEIRFPIFKVMLKDQYIKGALRNRLMKEVQNELDFMWKHFNLSYLTIQQIFHFMSNENLTFIAEAAAE